MMDTGIKLSTDNGADYSSQRLDALSAALDLSLVASSCFFGEQPIEGRAKNGVTKPEEDHS